MIVGYKLFIDFKYLLLRWALHNLWWIGMSMLIFVALVCSYLRIRFEQAKTKLGFTKSSDEKKPD